MWIEIHALSEQEAGRLTRENKYGAVWEPGVRIVIDDQLCVCKSRSEVNAVIDKLMAAANEMWPDAPPVKQ
jgi:hypothetical protein